MKLIRAWEFGASLALGTVIVLCGLAWIWFRNVEARANQSLVTEVTRGRTAGSSFTTELTDAMGGLYSVKLVARNEQAHANVEIWSGAEVGDRLVTGLYRFQLWRSGWKAPRPQQVWPFEGGYDGEFNLERRLTYKVRSRWKGQPDILVIEQYAGSNGNDGRLFTVRNGVLRRITFTLPTQKARPTFFWSPHDFSPVDRLRFRSFDYDNSRGVSSERLWRFEPETDRMIQISVQS